mmetsp:Transcript_22156/g.35175  ORF Transcript_22156/g.35175 Transcript_22156/m.35175 type:complete len:161 (+) Transcript_22156:66-548(+)
MIERCWAGDRCLRLTLTLASAAQVWSEDFQAGCRMPIVAWSPAAGSCHEAKGAAPGAYIVPHGGRCTAWCSTGYRATQAFLTCSNGVLSPETFSCSPAASQSQWSEAPEAYEMSRCMDDFFACGPKRLKYATHLAQAGDWESIDDESWRPMWPPPNDDQL